MAWQPFRNLGLKLVALLLGTLLWFTVSGQQVERTVPGVPVVYRNKPATLEITDQTNLVDIHVKGLDSQLRAVQARDFEARVDLSDVRAGSQSLSIRVDQISAPPGLEVRHIEPGSVNVVLEVAGSASLPVRPNIEGRPASGFVVSDVTVEPSSVTVLGPQQRVSLAKSATTDRVSIQGASSTVTQTVSVGVEDAALRLSEPRTARVVATIEAAGDRLFAALRVGIRNLEPGLKGTATPAVVAVQLQGAQAVLARLSPSAVAPYVDVTGLGPGRHEVPVLLDAMGRLSVASIRPATVIVEIH
jgi:YbbR domain-containing protein